MPKNILWPVTLALLFVSCTEPTPAPPRPPVAILYVGTPELFIYQQPSESSPLLATYREGEAVSVYETRGDWIEIALLNQETGWARRADLVETRQGGTSSTPRFRRPPNPVWSQKKISGEIVFEASVNPDGDVLSVRTLSNTTGDDTIAARNRTELLSAKFYPLARGGAPQPFVYEYRVSY